MKLLGGGPVEARRTELKLWPVRELGRCIWFDWREATPEEDGDQEEGDIYWESGRAACSHGDEAGLTRPELRSGKVNRGREGYG